MEELGACKHNETIHNELHEMATQVRSIFKERNSKANGCRGNRNEANGADDTQSGA